jgi:RNA polymerase sigma factor for flagellar operon FliA
LRGETQDEPEPEARPEEEQALWLEWTRAKSSKARERLFALHLRLALQIARQCFMRWMGSGADLADLRQLASVGLLEAIDAFDPGRGTPFGAYARGRIRGAVLDGMEKMSEVRSQIAARARARRERLASLRAGGGAASGARSTAVERLAEVAIGLALGFMLEGTNLYVDEETRDTRAHAYEQAAWRELVARLRAAVECLPEAERKVLEHHYVGTLTFAQVGDLLSLSEARISQIHKAAITVLRARLAHREALFFSG